MRRSTLTCLSEDNINEKNPKYAEGALKKLLIRKKHIKKHGTGKEAD